VGVVKEKGSFGYKTESKRIQYEKFGVDDASYF
jgi:hypothetical protein